MGAQDRGSQVQQRFSEYGDGKYTCGCLRWILYVSMSVLVVHGPELILIYTCTSRVV